MTPPPAGRPSRWPRAGPLAVRREAPGGGRRSVRVLPDLPASGAVSADAGTGATAAPRGFHSPGCGGAGVLLCSGALALPGTATPRRHLAGAGRSTHAEDVHPPARGTGGCARCMLAKTRHVPRNGTAEPGTAAQAGSGRALRNSQRDAACAPSRRMSAPVRQAGHGLAGRDLRWPAARGGRRPWSAAAPARCSALNGGGEAVAACTGRCRGSCGRAVRAIPGRRRRAGTVSARSRWP